MNDDVNEKANQGIEKDHVNFKGLNPDEITQLNNLVNKTREDNRFLNLKPHI